MKIVTLIAIAAASFSSIAPAAYAQTREIRRDQREVNQSQRELQRDINRGAPRAQIRSSRRELRSDRRELRQDRRQYNRSSRRAYNRYNRNHRWRRGQRLNTRYGRYYTVRDWRSHRLNRPPRGYRWVRQGDDYVLAALATGLIASVIAASR